MTERELGRLLLSLTALLAAGVVLGGALERARIPAILAALLVAMAASLLPFADVLTTPPLAEPFALLGQLGVLFLLFFIGMQIDLAEMRALGRDMVWATVLNTAVPFLLGVVVMRALGYGWTISFVVGLTRMPTAEAVIVPILDEFQMIRTRVGEFIVGAGVLDDVIEVLLVGFVSVWIAEREGVAGVGSELEGVALGLFLFVAASVVCYRWLLPWLGRWLAPEPRNLILIGTLALFGLGGLSEYGQLGLVVGAIIAGMVARPVVAGPGVGGERTTAALRTISYGLFGPIFFLWVGLSVDVPGLFREPTLAILLFLAAFVGKIAGVFILVPMGRITAREAWTIGVGLNARLTTEIIVARLLLGAGLIDEHLFTALVAASTLSTIIVPLTFTFLVRRWAHTLRPTALAPAPVESRP